MRAFFSTVCCTILAGSVAAGTHDGTGAHCLDRVAKEVHTGDSVSVVLNDSGIVRGNDLIVDGASSVLFMRPMTSSGAGSRIAIPLERISTITYTKPSPVRFGFVVLGMGAGALAGAAVGVALAPESKGIMPDSEIGSSFAGAVIGGLIGAACGWEIGNHFKLTVTLDCR